MRTSVGSLLTRLPQGEVTDDELEVYLTACVKASCIGLGPQEIIDRGLDPDKMELSSREVGALFGLADNTARSVLHQLRTQIAGELERMVRTGEEMAS